ncbi:MAG: hypothetical protein NVS3B28_18530 [Candidatus Velthaea sp.]
MSHITAASLPLLLAERFPDFGAAPELETSALLRQFLSYAVELEAHARFEDAARVFATIEEIVTSADYDVQDSMIVELVEAIEDAAMIERFGPATKKWWKYHIRERELNRRDP